MKKSKPENRTTGIQVSASALAQMGVCERRIVFEQRVGKRPTREQQQAMQRGLRAHRRFFREGSVGTAVAVPARSVLRMICRLIRRPIGWFISHCVKIVAHRNDI